MSEGAGEGDWGRKSHPLETFSARSRKLKVGPQQALTCLIQEFPPTGRDFSGRKSQGDLCPDIVCEAGKEVNQPSSCLSLPFTDEDTDGQRDSTARTRSHSKEENKGFLRLHSALGF